MAVTTQAATPAGHEGSRTATSSRPYFVSFTVDAMFVGGLSVLVFVLLQVGAGIADWGTSRSQAVISWAIWMAWIINWPHFAATNFRLYRSRETAKQYPVTAFVVPVLLIPATAAALALPETFAPWIVKLFLIWSPYHFSGQTIGVAVLYARRAGFTITPLMRWALTWFVFSTYIELQAKTEIPGGLTSFYGVTEIPAIGIPAWTADAALWGVVAMALLLVGASIDAVLKARRPFPLIMAVPVLAQLVWFQLAVGPWNTPSFLEFVPFFHALQYLFIAWFMQMKERQVVRKEPGSVRGLVAGTAAWGTAIFLGGALMFSWVPWFLAFAFPVSNAVATGVMLSMVQIHHFFVDGVIWKLRDPKVRGALGTSINDLVGRE